MKQFSTEVNQLNSFRSLQTLCLETFTHSSLYSTQVLLALHMDGTNIAICETASDIVVIFRSTSISQDVFCSHGPR